jgi:hypothetical protein
VLSLWVVLSMPSSLMQGWLVLGRVIDVPVYQDVLTWDDLAGAVLITWGNLYDQCSSSQVSVVYIVCLHCMKDVDVLADS